MSETLSATMAYSLQPTALMIHNGKMGF